MTKRIITVILMLSLLLACGAALLSSNIFIIRGRRNMAAKEAAR